MESLKILDEINPDRRRFVGAAAIAVAATQLGMIGPAAAQDPRAPPHLSPERVRPSDR